MDIKLKRWGPWIARLANVTPISRVYGKEMTEANWVYNIDCFLLWSKHGINVVWSSIPYIESWLEAFLEIPMKMD